MIKKLVANATPRVLIVSGTGAIVKVAVGQHALQQIHQGFHLGAAETLQMGIQGRGNCRQYLVGDFLACFRQLQPDNPAIFRAALAGKEFLGFQPVQRACHGARVDMGLPG